MNYAGLNVQIMFSPDDHAKYAWVRCHNEVKKLLSLKIHFGLF
jgi:hypothetical protein